MIVTKYKKKFRLKKIVNVKNKFLGLCQFGFYGIKAVSSGFLTNKQVETMRRVIAKITKRIGNIFIRVVFQHSLTGKSLHTRMGKGAGFIKN
jgi:large subunit ribosomal protein L16